jgi:hypothetical protein
MAEPHQLPLPYRHTYTPLPYPAPTAHILHALYTAHLALLPEGVTSYNILLTQHGLHVIPRAERDLSLDRPRARARMRRRAGRSQPTRLALPAGSSSTRARRTSCGTLPPRPCFATPVSPSIERRIRPFSHRSSSQAHGYHERIHDARFHPLLTATDFHHQITFLAPHIATPTGRAAPTLLFLPPARRLPTLPALLRRSSSETLGRPPGSTDDAVRSTTLTAR